MGYQCASTLSCSFVGKASKQAKTSSESTESSEHSWRTPVYEKRGSNSGVLSMSTTVICQLGLGPLVPLDRSRKKPVTGGATQ